ncbi:hypothetical protein D9611_010079 [Ephemerocybe angulata]|uniref:C2H2-type domain-containing protein n=1 Tax=Ephemerocybe angulata TaxID=980116 RepID=A0A8H5AZ51_9AGAR|nr:hypothetical protein D9611_010079 [Tulosesus angulatus]
MSRLGISSSRWRGEARLNVDSVNAGTVYYIGTRRRGGECPQALPQRTKYGRERAQSVRANCIRDVSFSYKHPSIMRMSTFPAILSVALFLSSYANAYHYDENEVYAREPYNVDTFTHEFTARDLLSELSTRELVYELERRVQHRPNSPKAPPAELSYKCKTCGLTFPSANQLSVHEIEHGRGTCKKCGSYSSDLHGAHVANCKGK